MVSDYLILIISLTFVGMAAAGAVGKFMIGNSWRASNEVLRQTIADYKAVAEHRAQQTEELNGESPTVRYRATDQQVTVTRLGGDHQAVQATSDAFLDRMQQHARRDPVTAYFLAPYITSTPTQKLDTVDLSIANQVAYRQYRLEQYRQANTVIGQSALITMAPDLTPRRHAADPPAITVSRGPDSLVVRVMFCLGMITLFNNQLLALVLIFWRLF